MKISMRRCRQNAVTWLLLLAGLSAIAVMTAAHVPGPWHGDNETTTNECQCPVCKIVGQGILASDAVVQPTPPEPVLCSVQIDPTFHDIRALVHDYPARAPPV